MQYWIAEGKDGIYRIFIEASAVYKSEDWYKIIKFMKAQQNVQIQTANIYDNKKLEDIVRLQTKQEVK